MKEQMRKRSNDKWKLSNGEKQAYSFSGKRTTNRLWYVSEILGIIKLVNKLKQKFS